MGLAISRTIAEAHQGRIDGGFEARRRDDLPPEPCRSIGIG